MKKRTLFFFLALALLCALLPQAATVARASSYSGSCGDSLTWTFNPDSGALTIEGSGDMEDYILYYEAPWYQYCASVCSLSLPEGLTSIGENAFNGCVGLPYAKIPGSVTRIGRDAFYGCSVFDLEVKAANCNIYNDIRTLGYPGFTILHGYQGSTTETYARENGYVFVEIGNAVSGTCGAFGEDLIWAFNRDTGVLTVTGSGRMMDFLDPCSVPWKKHTSYITTASFSEELTSIGDFAFVSCNALRSVTIPESVIRIGCGAFEYCDALRSVTISAGVTSIDFLAFLGCPSLRTVTIYNPNCQIADSQETLGDPAKTVLCGYWNSTAQRYAEKWGYSFRPLSGFTDVNPAAYYATPVAWAVENGITSGTGEDSFSPNKVCTREQVAAFLWRANGSPAPGGTDNPFSDVRADQYCEQAVLWAYYHRPQITSGVGTASFGVGRPCTRAQVVTFLWNAAGKPEPTAQETPFTDLDPAAYYYKPVLWAVENGVTSGFTPTSFGPNKTCTRAQVVTFLYRAYEG